MSTIIVRTHCGCDWEIWSSTCLLSWRPLAVLRPTAEVTYHRPLQSNSLFICTTPNHNIHYLQGRDLRLWRGQSSALWRQWRPKKLPFSRTTRLSQTRLGVRLVERTEMMEKKGGGGGRVRQPHSLPLSLSLSPSLSLSLSLWLPCNHGE